MFVCLHFFCLVEMPRYFMTRCHVDGGEQNEGIAPKIGFYCKYRKSYEGGQIVMFLAWICEKFFVSLRAVEGGRLSYSHLYHMGKVKYS